jgi:hypothetical protein
VLLDLLVLLVLAGFALHGATGGALKQVVQLLAALVGWLAARDLAAPVGAGLTRWFPAFLARPAASAILFFGAFALVSLLGAAALRASAISTVVRGPTDRGAGAVLAGVKGWVVVWVLLSALAFAGGALRGRLGAMAAGSQYLSLARAHNLLQQLDPERARVLERVLAAAREAQKTGAKASPEAAQLLADPRMKALADAGGGVDPAEAERLLDDPVIRDLVERIRERTAQ